MNGKHVLSADIRSSVYSAVAKNVDEDSWEQLMKLHRVKDIHTQRT